MCYQTPRCFHQVDCWGTQPLALSWGQKLLVARRARRSAGEQQEAGQRFASAWCSDLLHWAWYNQRGLVHSLPFTLLEWSGLVLACAWVIQAVLETHVMSKLHEQIKLSPFRKPVFLSACCQRRRKANIKAPLALLALIIIYRRVVARVPVMHEAVPDSQSLQIKHSCLFVPSFTRKIANSQ